MVVYIELFNCPLLNYFGDLVEIHIELDRALLQGKDYMISI